MSLVETRRVLVEIGLAVLVGAQHPFAPDDARHRLHRALELRGWQARRKGQLHRWPSFSAGAAAGAGCLPSMAGTFCRAKA